MENQEFATPRPRYDILHKIADILNLYFAMYLSKILLMNPVFGGALFLIGQIWVVLARLYGKKRGFYLPFGLQSKGLTILIITIILNVVLVVFYPWITRTENTHMMFLFVVIVVGRAVLSDFLLYRVPRKIRRWLMVGIHLVCMGISVLLFIDEPAFWLVLAGIEAGGLFLLMQQILAAGQEPASFNLDVDQEKILKISSYKIYNRMTINTYTALYLSIMLYLAMAQFSSEGNLLSDMFSSFIWMVLVAGVSGLSYLWFKQRPIVRTERNVVFVLGAAFWALAGVMQFNRLDISGFDLAWGALWAIGIGCVFAAMMHMNNEMKMVVELVTDDIPEGLMKQNTRMMEDLALLSAEMIMVVVMTIYSFIMSGYIEQVENNELTISIRNTGMTLLPATFVIFGIFDAIRQPLNRLYGEKLLKYHEQKQQGNVNKKLEDRLRGVLVGKYRKRLGIRVVAAVIWPFYRHKVMNKEVVDFSNGPVIFICNHAEIYGPMVTNLYFPFYFRPWIISQMITKDQVAKHMYEGSFARVKWLPEKMKRGIVDFLSPLACWLLNSTDPIPVYRNDIRKIMETIERSVDAMEYDDNILIFPEDPEATPEKKYPEKGIAPLQTGFVHLAKAYYRRTGKKAVFYPVYANKEKRRISFAPGIEYQPCAGARAERERIVDYLTTEIEKMAEQ